MHALKRPFAILLLLLSLPVQVLAQSTDGFHEIQVFPVVVDTSSFSQRFSFRTTQVGSAPVAPRYYPAVGTSQPNAIDCPPFEIPWAGKTFDSLRDLCPGLASGSQYGFLVLEQTGPAHRSFSGYSRVSNTTGGGFSVEAFPAHTFTSAFSTATGLRRKAASAGAPAFQTNCFIGLMGEHNGPSTTSRVLLGLFDNTGAQLGEALTYDLLPGQLVRVLDIFGAVGAPAGDHDRASMVARQVVQIDEKRPGIISFCTVQDNTSFSADFRIAKQEYGILSNDVPLGPGTYDGHVMRVTLSFSNPGGPSFSLGKASFQQNTHVFYFRHPDWVSCDIVDPSTFARMSPDKGLEMRLLAWDTDQFTPLAGGPGITGFDRIYLGDKRQRAEGYNTEYLLQVENNVAVPESAEVINYALRCWSGSGHTRGDMITYRRDANDF